MSQPRIVRAGNAAAAGAPIIAVAHQFVPVYSVAGVLTPLFSYTIPEHGLAFDGDMIEFEIYGHVAPGVGEQIIAKIAGVAILDTGAIDTLAGDYVLRGRVVRVDVETVNVAATLQSSAVSLYHVDAGYGFDPRINNDFVVSGLGPTDNDVSVALAIVNFRGQG